MTAFRFRLFNVPVQILPGFWLLLLLLGVLMGGASVAAFFMVVGVAFVSLLAHELGHAFAARSSGFKPSITLHLTGGLTSYATVQRVSRVRDVGISVAGPLAGFGLAALAYGLITLYGGRPEEDVKSPFLLLLWWTVQLNVFWSILNLLPVIPFDGGRILLALVGDQRRHLAAGISLFVGMSVALLFMAIREPWAALVFATASVMSFVRLQQAANVVSDMTPEEAGRLVVKAEEALEREAFEDARANAERVFLACDQPALRRRALQTVLWALLGQGQVKGAATLVDAVDASDVDPHLRGAVFHADGKREAAIEVLSKARANGDQRLQLAALLVRVYFEAERYAEAARLTLEIRNDIPSEEARQVAREAEKAGALLDAARLSLELARAESSFSDAQAALFSFAAAGEKQRATEAFRLALGFDRKKSQALLTDERLDALRGELEACA